MIIPDDHAHLIFSHTITGLNDPVAWTLGVYVDDTGAGGPSGPVDVANRAFDCWVDNIKLQTANEVTLTEVVAYYRQGADLLVGYSTRAASVGTQGTGSAPPAVSFLIRKNTGLAGRKYRGRAFMPGIRDTAVEANGSLSSVFQAQINVALEAFRVDLEDDGLAGWAIRPRILHSLATDAPTAITSFTVDPFVGTQRRRQR